MGLVLAWVNPELFAIAGVSVKTYGFFMAVAFVVIHVMLARHLGRAKLLAVDPSDMVLAAVLGGVVGAKLHYLLTWDFSSLEDMLATSGLSFQGGAIGGFLAVVGLLKYHGQAVHKYIDICLHLLPLGHAIGKLGCFFAGDGCYGAVTAASWGMAFPNGLVPTRPDTFVHPVPLYEFVLSISVFAWFAQKQDTTTTTPGLLASEVMISFCLTRVLVEIWRDHPSVVLGLSQFQLLALGIAGIAGVARLFIVRRTKLRSKEA